MTAEISEPTMERADEFIQDLESAGRKGLPCNAGHDRPARRGRRLALRGEPGCETGRDQI
jgi:hypothetical protein